MTITPATHAISINPATGEQLSVLPWAGVDDIENALQLAAAGFRDWREANIDYRAEKLRDIGKALRARSEEMAQMITREMGKPINQARAEVAKSANLCDWYAEHGPAMLKRNLRWWKISRRLLSIDRWGRFWRLCRGIFRYGR